MAAVLGCHLLIHLVGAAHGQHGLPAMLQHTEDGVSNLVPGARTSQWQPCHLPAGERLFTSVVYRYCNTIHSFVSDLSII